MNEPPSATLGQAWLELVQRTLVEGVRLREEGREVLCATVSFPATTDGDPLIERFGDPRMVAEMEAVFFADGLPASGHSYAGLMHGPAGRRDLQDIIALLRADPFTKRAVVTFCGAPGAKVPCINAIQFLVRDGAVQAIYFARGQDAFRKFYADGLCLAAMARTVAGGLDLPPGRVTGFIGSSHVYDRDLSAIGQMLAQAGAPRSAARPEGER